MKIIQSKETAFNLETVVTIGTFDGVHIGHQKIIKKLIGTGKKSYLKSVVLTFFPHPRMVVQKDANIKLINTINERSDIFNNLGLDYLFIKKFTPEFSRLSAEDFVSQVIIDELNAKKIIIGYDHHFGRNRAANINDLREFGEKYGFEVEEISAQDINDVAISSTKIRHALNHGDIETANSYLGYNFMLTGVVKHGKGIGKELNFPTANIHIDEDYKLIPKHGAYIVSSIINDELIYGMMNIGKNPTINHGNQESIEVHFFNFKESIYNQTLKIDILKRLRDEHKFDSIEALKHQLEIDKVNALKFISETYND